MMSPMRSLPADYKGIYDPLNNEDHMRTRLVPESWDRPAHYAHYEPYGRNSKEKEDYIDSINREHELWSLPFEEDDREKKVSFVVEGLFMSRDSYQLNGGLWPGQYMSDVFLRVPQKLEMEVIYPEMWKEDIDTSDRGKKASYAFAQMLAVYVEKCSESEKKTFFDRGGKGWKWSQDKELMKKVGKLFERENCNIRDDPNYCISLSDISVKSYPRHHFLKICDLFLDFMEKKEEVSSLNPWAKEFVPGQCFISPLVRQSPKKITGVYAIEQPKKPPGVPKSRRPKASSNNSTSQLCWQMKGETDSKIEDLQKKIDLLLQLSVGPVVEAKRV